MIKKIKKHKEEIENINNLVFSKSLDTSHIPEIDELNESEFDIINKYETLKNKYVTELDETNTTLLKIISDEENLKKELDISKSKNKIKQIYDTLKLIKYSEKCKKCCENKNNLSNIEINNFDDIRSEKKISKEIKKLEIDKYKEKKSNIENNILMVDINRENEITQHKIKLQNMEENKKLRNEKIKLIENEYKINKKEFEMNNNIKKENILKEIKQIETDINNYKLIENDIILKKTLEENNIKIQNILKKIDELKNLKDDIIKLEKELEQMKQFKINSEIFVKIKNDLTDILKKENDERNKLNMNVKNMNELNKKQGEITGVEEIYNTKTKQIEKNKIAYNKALKIIDLYEKNNFIGYILDNYINRLEEIVNNVLMSIVDYKIKIVHDNDELKIYKIENNILINIRQLSGNEKFLINIAVKTAFNKISISFKSNFFIIDEGFGSCDSKKLEKINNLFEILKNDFDMCLVISHLDVIKDMKNHQINIKRNKEGYSYIAV